MIKEGIDKCVKSIKNFSMWSLSLKVEVLHFGKKTVTIYERICNHMAIY